MAEALARLERFHEINGNSLKRPAATQTHRERQCEITHYDLVLTDLNLPDGSGKTLLAQIRSSRLPLPVVVLTGSGSEEMLLALLRAGADDYVIKGGVSWRRFLSCCGLHSINSIRETFWRAAALKMIYVDPNTHDVDLTKRELVALAPHLNIEFLQTAEQVFDRFSISELTP